MRLSEDKNMLNNLSHRLKREVTELRSNSTNKYLSELTGFEKSIKPKIM